MSSPAEGKPMTSMPSALPEGSVLLHIGPYKTGSTALQSSLFAARDDFAQYGVYYPGGWRRAAREGWSVLRWSPRGRPPPPPLEVWKAFAEDIRTHSGDRVCVSTEDFAATREFRAREIVEDLGGDRVHVVMVARRFDRLLPSAWQERIKGHDTRTYDAWLHDVLDEDSASQAHRAFWRSHDVNRVAEQWLPSVGAERFHVILSDDTDPHLLNRTFEAWLGLPSGTLRAAETANASMSANSCELIRRVNERFDANEWSDDLYHHLIYHGATSAMIAAGRADGDERIPPLPGWAADAVRTISEGRNDDLTRLGLQVVGDPASLVPPAPQVDRVDTSTSRISLDQAEAALLGTVGAAIEQLRVGEDAPGTRGSLDDYTGRALLSAAVRRVPAAAKRLLPGRARRRSEASG